jgi:predicted nucleic acid-binding protein
MSGKKVLVDTNIVIYTLGGRKELSERVKGSTVYLSVISEMEARCYPSLDEIARTRVEEYIRRCTRIGLEERVKEEAIRIRSIYRLKLPDAIVAATAMVFDLPLLSADQVFMRVSHELALELYQL